jgi:hypothetical protein
MLVYGEVGCRKALGGFQRTNRTAVQFESGKGDVKNSAAAFVFLKCQKLLCTQPSGNTPHQFKKGRMIIMKMKKFLSSLTAGNDHFHQCIGDPDDVPRCDSGR